MGYNLAIYEAEHRAIVHQPSCQTFSTVARHYHSGHIVHVGPDWTVVTCPKCRPSVYVVRVSSHHVTIDEMDQMDSMGQMDPRDVVYWTRKPHRFKQPRSWPPIGITALDITGSNIDICECGHSHHCHEPWCRECECDGWKQWAWWKLGNCRDEGGLGEWLTWLYVGDDEANQTHWAVTVQKVICSDCVVRAECLEQGVWGQEEWGIWGGATKAERKGLRRKWKKEGRRDERAKGLRGQDGSGIAVAIRPSNGRTSQDESSAAAEDQGVPEVSVGIEVRWPRTYPWSGERWGRAGASDW